ncbi:hypothetical protein BC827DRAFT_648032 [Russula dissimulans]|nr:hypothetical protein BC827DRAFT_648032 [Russula dissimulans]
MTTDMYKYLVYKPSTNNARIRAQRETLYHRPGDESLYAGAERYLVDITWVSTMSWRNDTAAAQTYSHTFTTELKITQGSEVNNGFSLGASYKGMSVGFNETRTFKSTETTESRTITITLTILPRSHLVFYQRRYTFRDSIFFILDTWNQEWNVGSWGGYALTWKHADVHIMSENYATLEEELDGSTMGTISVSTVSPIPSGGHLTRKRENITQRAKNMIDSMGA